MPAGDLAVIGQLLAIVSDNTLDSPIAGAAWYAPLVAAMKTYGVNTTQVLNLLADVQDVTAQLKTQAGERQHGCWVRTAE